jgi:uncharacterized protein with NRDE domain
MCLIVFEINEDLGGGIILAANRDEFYERPTMAAQPWEDLPEIIAGRDLVGGGTWLGITRRGRFAAVTNYRDPAAPKGTRSRGELVAGFLASKLSAAQYLEQVARISGDYSGFNLIVGELTGSRLAAAWFSNRDYNIRELKPGLYGLSNHLLDTPWPKVRRAKELFVSASVDSDEGIFDLLKDRSVAPDDELPNTGVGLERERMLSPIFIESPTYGTRCSTVVRINTRSEPSLVERVYV